MRGQGRDKIGGREDQTRTGAQNLYVPTCVVLVGGGRRRRREKGKLGEEEEDYKTLLNTFHQVKTSKPKLKLANLR